MVTHFVCVCVCVAGYSRLRKIITSAVREKSKVGKISTNTTTYRNR